MRLRYTLLIVVGVAAGAGLLFFLSATLPFRANRILYLMNARHFGQAMTEYEALCQKHPRDAQRLPDNFRTILIKNAARYYSQPFIRKLEGADYQALLALAEQRQELAPLARHKRLEFMALLDSKSSGTLRAAREILVREGFDAEALWWAVNNQYDPSRPLDIPRELAQWRAPLEKVLNTAPPSPADRQQEARAALLRALLALQDRNWAEAAGAFARYREIFPEMDNLDLVQGMTALKAGRPASAIHFLMQYRSKRPSSGEARRWLAEAYLATEDYPWACQALHEIRATAPAQEQLVFQDCFGTSGSGALQTLCGSVRPGGAFDGNVKLWHWLAEMARTDAERQAADSVAHELIASGPRRPDEVPLLLQHCLRRGMFDDACRLMTATDARVTSATHAPTRRQVFEDIQDWVLMSAARRIQLKDSWTSASLARLTRDTTRRIPLDIQQGATMAVFQMRGTPGGEVWPIVHVDLGEYGAQTFYLGDSHNAPRVLILTLRRPVGREQTIHAAVSLINSRDGGGQGRTVDIMGARAF